MEGVQRALADRPSTFLARLEPELIKEFSDIATQEEVFWKQRSRLTWLSMGERNTTAFHKSVVRRRSNSVIHQLKNLQGHWINEAQELRDMVLKYFTDLYTKGQKGRTGPSVFDFPQLSHSDRRSLNHMVSPKEVESAIFQTTANKASGPDGYPPAFYQKNWNVVGNKCTAFVMEAFRKRRYSEHMNESTVVLIPKTKNPESINQFRPIALSNVITKTITKIIANRLKLIIDKIVTPTQSAFMPGRQASENIVIAQEVLHCMRNKKGCRGYMAIKVDLEKAYDMVDWAFLRDVL